MALTKVKVITVPLTKRVKNQKKLIPQRLCRWAWQRHWNRRSCHWLKEGWDVTNLYTIVPLRASPLKSWLSRPWAEDCAFPTAKELAPKPPVPSTITPMTVFQEIIDRTITTDNSIIKKVLYIRLDDDETVYQKKTPMQIIVPSAGWIPVGRKSSHW